MEDINNISSVVFIGGAILLVVFIAAVAFFFLKRTGKPPSKKKSKKSILILGPREGGKTTLYSTLNNLNVVKTQTSLIPNESDITMDENKKIGLVDIPGHDRLRNGFLMEHSNNGDAIGVIFMFDSVAFIRNPRPVAECFYDILCKENLASCPVLVLSNKHDIPTAPKKIERVQRKLESEFTEIRESRRGAIAGTNETYNEADAFLGDEDEDEFEFSQLNRNIIFSKGSLKADKDETKASVMEWISNTVLA
eukprot:m.8166 g.8166  ORF g.8166 m.8166 type:complete len:251 (-) comp3037_c0_seq1:132-884(-)